MMMFFLVDGHNFPHWVAAARPETLLPKTIFTLGASLMPLDLIKLQWFE